jgi:hypothetical protein
MNTTYDKIVQHVGATMGQDISSELLHREKVEVKAPTHPPEALQRHKDEVELHKKKAARLALAREAERKLLRVEVSKKVEGAAVRLALLENEIEQAEYEAAIEPPVTLNPTEKTLFDNASRNHRERTRALEEHRGKAFSLIKGQCTQRLIDQMRKDKDWEDTSVSYDPLALYELIEKTILEQNGNQYPCATVYDHECSMYGFQQQKLSDNQYYEKFNTKVDIGDAIGVT